MMCVTVGHFQAAASATDISGRSELSQACELGRIVKVGRIVNIHLRDSDGFAQNFIDLLVFSWNFVDFH